MTTRPPLLRHVLAALVSGLAVAAAVWAAVTLLYFSAGLVGTSAPSFWSIGQFFVPAGLVLFVLLSVAALLRAYRRWYWTLPLAIVVSFITAVLGTTFAFLTEGGTLSGPAWASIFATLGGENLLFMVVSVIGILTIARPVYGSIASLTLESTSEVHRVALVRSPASTLAKGELTHLKRKPVKLDLADTQWEAYVAALEAEGFSTIEVEVADEHPDSVFVEDAAVILGQTAVIGSPGAESRRGEQDAVAAAVSDLGLGLRQIRLPGTLDGGDVLKVGKTVYVGRGGRTNAEGIRQFRAIAGELGYRVVAVPVTKALHLKSSVTALPDGTVLGFPGLVDHPELFNRYLEVPEASGVAVVVLSPSAVLMAASAPKTAALIADLGYRVVTVDISEFEKLEGCVTCLSVRIR
jgi:dimethylargininase